MAHRLEQGLHLRRLTHDVLESVLARHLFLETLGFAFQGDASQAPLQDHQELVTVEGLGEVVRSPPPHGFDGTLDRAESGHQYDLHLRLTLLEALHERESVHPGHLEVGQNHVGRKLTGGGERAKSVGCRAYLVAFVLEDFAQGSPGARLVIDY